MNNFYFDLETFLISPGVQAPPIVCMTFCIEEESSELFGSENSGRIYDYLENGFRFERLVGHNVAFDLACIAATWPDLIPLIFQAYAEDRVTDTMVRQKLIDIGRGRQKDDAKLRYDLGSVSLRCGGPILDKEDPWRLKYGTLYNVPVAEWPEEAKTYALKDAEATRAVFLAQEQHSEYLVDQYRQARAAWWIKLMESWGFKTDKAQAERYIRKVQKTLEEDRVIGVEAGLIRPDGTKNVKAAQAWMLRVCEEAGETCPQTDGGLPSLSEESVEEHGDYVLEAYQRYANANTRTKRAQRLLEAANAGVPIQSRFNVLVNTGRTSCSQGDERKKSTGIPTAYGAQIQNPSKDKGYRECFVPRSGYGLVSIDYDALELRTWAQVCIWLFGFSKLAEALNQGRDPHTELGGNVAGISVEKAYELKKSSDDFNNGYRFFAKAGNFMFPGGGGAPKFVKTLVKQAVHMGDPTTIARAKSYSLQEAKALKNTWLRTWPEAQKYFEWANSVLAGREQASFSHFKSGRIRSGMYYCQLCNSPFQGLGADIKKDAFFRISRLAYCEPGSPLYGARLVDDVHDEGLWEIPLDRLHDGAYLARDILCQTAQEWAPDLKFTAEPAAMDRWSKNAKTRKVDGRLVVDVIELE